MYKINKIFSLLYLYEKSKTNYLMSFQFSSSNKQTCQNKDPKNNENFDQLNKANKDQFNQSAHKFHEEAPDQIGKGSVGKDISKNRNVDFKEDVGNEGYTNIGENLYKDQFNTLGHSEGNKFLKREDNIISKEIPEDVKKKKEETVGTQNNENQKEKENIKELTSLGDSFNPSSRPFHHDYDLDKEYVKDILGSTNKEEYNQDTNQTETLENKNLSGTQKNVLDKEQKGDEINRNEQLTQKEVL